MYYLCVGRKSCTSNSHWIKMWHRCETSSSPDDFCKNLKGLYMPRWSWWNSEALGVESQWAYYWTWAIGEYWGKTWSLVYKIYDMHWKPAWFIQFISLGRDNFRSPWVCSLSLGHFLCVFMPCSWPMETVQFKILLVYSQDYTTITPI